MKNQRQTIIKLPKRIEGRDIGINYKNILKQVWRNDKIAWYQRSDGVHEVFIIKTEYDENGQVREKYPENYDFGHSAWNFLSHKKALRKFRILTKTSCNGKNRR